MTDRFVYQLWGALGVLWVGAAGLWCVLWLT